MKVRHTSLPGVLVVGYDAFHDERGYLTELFNDRRFEGVGLPVEFRQDNHSRSTRGVIRGLHYQLEHPQGKLVTVVRGSVFDVAVDVRRGSPAFGQWFGAVLSESEPTALWIPPGFAHGFCVTSDVADVIYKCTDVYHPTDNRSVLWSDPGLAIPWPVDHPILSDKDREAMPLDVARDDLPVYRPEQPEVSVDAQS